MTTVISLISQKGGVGKTTLARAIAYEGHKEGLNVKVADFDLQQGTFVKWHQKRLLEDLEPIGSVELYKTVEKALDDTKDKGYDLLILDDKGLATEKTHAMARVSDVVILPTGVSIDDTTPTIVLARTLVKEGIPKDKIIITLSRVGSESTANEAREELEKHGFRVSQGYVEEKTSYVRALNTGRTILETSYNSVNEKSQIFINSLIDLITKE